MAIWILNLVVCIHLCVKSRIFNLNCVKKIIMFVFHAHFTQKNAIQSFRIICKPVINLINIVSMVVMHAWAIEKLWYSFAKVAIACQHFLCSDSYHNKLHNIGRKDRQFQSINIYIYSSRKHRRTLSISVLRVCLSSYICYCFRHFTYTYIYTWGWG